MPGGWLQLMLISMGRSKQGLSSWPITGLEKKGEAIVLTKTKTFRRVEPKRAMTYVWFTRNSSILEFAIFLSKLCSIT